jgi:hypothetical protein
LDWTGKQPLFGVFNSMRMLFNFWGTISKWFGNYFPMIFFCLEFWVDFDLIWYTALEIWTGSGSLGFSARLWGHHRNCFARLLLILIISYFYMYFNWLPNLRICEREKWNWKGGHYFFNSFTFGSQLIYLVANHLRDVMLNWSYLTSWI